MEADPLIKLALEGFKIGANLEARTLLIAVGDIALGDRVLTDEELVFETDTENSQFDTLQGGESLHPLPPAAE